MEITAKDVDSILRLKVSEAMEEVVATGRPFTSKKLEEVAAGILFVGLRRHMPDLTPHDVNKRAVYAARNFIDTQQRLKRISTEGKMVSYPLVWQLSPIHRRQRVSDGRPVFQTAGRHVVRKRSSRRCLGEPVVERVIEPEGRRPRANGLPAVPPIDTAGTTTRVVCLDRAKGRFVAFYVYEASGHAIACFSLATRGGRQHWAALDIHGDMAAAALRKGRIKPALGARFF